MAIPFTGLVYSAFPILAAIEGSASAALEREVALARIVLGLAGLSVIIFPIRVRRVWAGWAIGPFWMGYLVPVFVLPVLVPFPGWHIFWTGFIEPGLARIALINLGFCASILVGIVLYLIEVYLAGDGRTPGAPVAAES